MEHDFFLYPLTPYLVFEFRSADLVDMLNINWAASSCFFYDLKD